MTKIGAMFKRKNIKAKQNPMAKKKPKKRVSKATTKKTNSKHMSNGKRFRLGFGIFLILFSIYLLFAQLFYLRYWSEDFNIVHQFDWTQLDGSKVTKNWGGPIGVWLAHQTIYNMFGVAALGFVLILFLFGQKITTRKTWLPFIRTSKITFLIMIWSSVFFGTVFRESVWSILGGAFGYQSSLWLEYRIGFLGLLLILIFSLILLFIVPFAKMGRKANLWRKEKQASLQDKRAEALLKEKEQTTSATQDNWQEDKYNTNEFAVSDVSDEKDNNTSTPFVINDPHNETIEEQAAVDNDNDLELVINDDTPKEETPPNSDLEVEVNSGVAILDGTPQIPAEDDTEPEQPLEKSHGIDTPYDPREDLSDYKFPTLDLLVDYGSDTINVYKEELEANKNRIVETLSYYNIKIQKIKATVGPTVTLYEIVPAPGIRISKIRNLEDDIALSLSALGIRIIAPIPGRGSVGIEVPNSKPEIVPMKSVLQSKAYQDSKYELPIVLGKTINNESYVFDLAKMPHLLMAGATGQGKSVGLNAIIASLLYKKHPAELKFVMVDPKKVELTLFSKIERHFLAKLPDSEEAIITDTQIVVNTLYSLVKEMDTRYDLLKEAQVRNIKEYNAKFIARKLNPENGHRYMPYIVLIVDEFADLMMTAGKEIESPIARLAQLARAIGIHLIIATQRPSVNVITGIIKANFPARIAFRVTSRIDSRTILDAGGADQLIGRGDMLMSTGNDMVRLQCAFVDTPEVADITDFIGSQRAYTSAYILPEADKELGEQEKDINPADRDSMFEDAARVVVNAQQGSTSLIQRKLKLGYNRAGRIIDQLEAAGIVGPFEGSKAREVRVSDEIALEQFLKDMYAREQE